MIFVVVRESGEYSDYNMELMFASTDKSIAETKLQELEEREKPLKKAYAEYRVLMDEYKKAYPATVSSSLDHNEFRKRYDAENDFSWASNQMLKEKYNIDPSFFDWEVSGYDERTYRIIEVESA
jgi:hypothetical protein